jgi:two-component system sensor histidine kinase/response regulator
LKTFTSDENRIKQILINLLSNAIKYTDQGGIIIQVSKETMMKENKLVKMLKIQVIDTGVGMSGEDMEGLFNLYGKM